MSTQDSWYSGSGLLLVLGVAVLIVAAWYGGRWSAGDGGPFGMMTGRMQNGHMHGNGMMTDGQGSDRSGTGEFDGKTGLRRCRAMLGTMTGMHRSMQSMGREGEGGGPMGSDASNRPSAQGRMDEHRMGSMHGGRRDMMKQGSHEDLSPEQMRNLCRTMHDALRTAMHGDPGDTPSTETDSALTDAGLDAETRQWLQSTRGFEQIADRRGQDEVVVEVGAGDGLQYAPGAVRVDPGTTVRWRWTGKGGLHDVAFRNADIGTALQGNEGATFTHTFNDVGTYRYECTPHAGVGMRGVVIVASQA